MTAIVYIITALITFYAGGICRSAPIMTLSVVEGIVFALMLILCIFQLKNIRCVFSRNISAGYKNTEINVPLKIYNGSFIPQTNTTLYCKYRQSNDKKGKKIKIKTSVSGNSHKSINAVVKGEYCGIIHLYSQKIKTGDLLGIFRLSKKWRSAADVLVLPAEKALSIKRSGNTPYNDFGEKSSGINGDSREIQQIREYRSGDSFRNIHWNISARTDELYYKEFGNTQRETVTLVIDIDKEDIADTKNADAFYRICSAVILGLFENMGNVSVQLSDGAAPMLMSSKEDMRDILTRLYYHNPDKTIFSNVESCFLLNSKPELYSDKRLIHRFSRENIENDIDTLRLYI